jgi:hypothetical protein
MPGSRQRSRSAFAMQNCSSYARLFCRLNREQSRLGLIVALRSKTVDSRVFKLLYLTAIAAAMIGWSWMLVKGLAWALDI